MSDLQHQLGCTAVMRPITIRDEVTNQKISIRISPRYSILVVGTRAYYFKRENGAYEGIAVTVAE
jgi:hypothetical protein